MQISPRSRVEVAENVLMQPRIGIVVLPRIPLVEREPVAVRIRVGVREVIAERRWRQIPAPDELVVVRLHDGTRRVQVIRQDVLMS